MGWNDRMVIVGDGVVGWSIALSLLDRGHREITVIGEGEDGRRSSPRYGGLLLDPLDAELGGLFGASLEAYRQRLGAAVSGPTDVVLLGYQQPVVERALELASFGELDPRMLPPRDVVRFGVPRKWSACRLHHAGYLVSPRQVTTALRDSARRDVEFRQGTATLSWERKGVCRGVLIDGRPLRGTVIATGGGLGRLIRRPGQPGLPLESRLDMSAVLAGVLPPDIPLLEEAGAQANDEIGQDATAFTLIGVPDRTPEGPTCVLAASFSLEGRPDPSRFWPRLLEHGQEFYPALEHARLMSLDGWARPVAPDGRPYIGRVPGTNVWIGGGAGSNELGLGWVIGVTLAHAIGAGTEDVIPAALRAGRELPP